MAGDAPAPSPSPAPPRLPAGAGLWVLVLLLLLPATVGPVGAQEGDAAAGTVAAAAAGTVELLDARLPTRRASTAAVWTGEAAYVFGGHGEAFSDEVLRFDPANGTVERLDGVKLPSPRRGVAAVWTGEAAYLFGGVGPDGELDEIVRFDPGGGPAGGGPTVELLDVRLPAPNRCSAAVWTGEAAYVLGGRSGDPYLDTVVRFTPGRGPGGGPGAAPGGDPGGDPEGAAVEVTDLRLPTGRDYLSAVWTGTEALLFGGETRDEATGRRFQTDEILRIDPAAGRVRTAEARLPDGLAMTAAAWSGRYAYVAGGLGADGATSAVLRYDPASDSMEELPLRLPTARFFMSAVWTGREALVFGGSATAGDQVLRVDPPNEAPLVRAAHAVLPGGRVTLDLAGSLDGDGSIVEVVVDWGDGTVRTTAPDLGPGWTLLDHRYEGPGPHPITVTATDDQGATGRAAFTVGDDPDPAPVPAAAPWAALLLAAALLGLVAWALRS